MALARRVRGELQGRRSAARRRGLPLEGPGVRQTGDVATVKLEDDYLGARFTDYLTLINHEGRWGRS